MKEDDASEERMLMAALKAGKGCPSVEQLDQLLDPARAASSSIAEHVASCTHCQTELELLRQFHADTLRESEGEAVRLIKARLRAGSQEIFRTSASRTELREPWWKAWWHSASLGRMALALSAIVLVAVITVQLRHRPPELRVPVPNQEVLRSNAMSVISPIGDVASAPNEIQWQAVTGAAQYEAELLEVDGAELWKEKTREIRIEIPAAVRARIVPAKTLLCRVSAFDSSGRRIAQSEAIRFRLLQKVYKP